MNYPGELSAYVDYRHIHEFLLSSPFLSKRKFREKRERPEENRLEIYQIAPNHEAEFGFMPNSGFGLRSLLSARPSSCDVL